MNSEIDLEKARTLFSYLSDAAKRYHAKEIEQFKIRLEIKKLKKLSTKSLRKHLDELERRLEESIIKGKKLAGYQKHEGVIHQRLKEKIANLERKLGRYLETRKGRINRIKKIEEKVAGNLADKNERIALLYDEVRRLEQLYKKLQKNKKVSRSRLGGIKIRINILKESLKSFTSQQNN